MSVTVNKNSPIQDYVRPDDQTQPTFENAFDEKKERPGLKFIPGLALTGLETTRPWSYDLGLDVRPLDVRSPGRKTPAFKTAGCKTPGRKTPGCKTPGCKILWSKEPWM